MDWKWRRLEKDWRWTDGGLEVDSMDEMGTGGGLHEDPWGSVRYRQNQRGKQPVSYTLPRILVEFTSSPYFIHGVHLQSTISPPPVLLQSPPLPVHSSWSPGGVDWRWILDLAKRGLNLWHCHGKHNVQSQFQIQCLI